MMLKRRSLLFLATLTMMWTLSRSLLIPQGRRFAASSVSVKIAKRAVPLVLRSYTDDQVSESSSTSSSSPQQPTNTTMFDQPLNGARAPNPPSPEFDASSILAIDPEDIMVMTLAYNASQSPPEPDMIRRLPFVSMFRGSANYIANHRGTTAVYHLPGGLLDLPDPSIFRDLMNDIALTWLLGMNIVLVAGCRHQVEKRLKDNSCSHGLRVTDSDTLRIVKEEAGYVRFEVERQLARSLRIQGAGGTSGVGHYDGNVVSGNFYSAQPFGILDGIDYQ